MFNSPWKAYRFIQRRIALKVTFFSIMLIKVKEELENFFVFGTNYLEHLVNSHIMNPSPGDFFNLCFGFSFR